jgi:hypothetical protein
MSNTKIPPPRRFATRLPLILTIILSTSTAGFPQELEIDNELLASTELLTEDLANRLLEFSVKARRGDMPGIGEYFVESLRATPMPTPMAAEPRVKWIARRSWTIPAEAEIARERFIASFEKFLLHLPVIEDVRFKVKYSTVAPDRRSAHGKLKFFLLGRNGAGEREWIKGLLEFAAVRSENDPWKLSRFALTEITSKIAAVDLFAEVGGPAGVAVTDPPFFEQEGEGYIWRGAAAADVDGDHRLDLFVVGYGANGLYLGRGDGTFEEVAEEALIDRFPHNGVQPLFVDIDNDGDLDLFVTSVGEQLLFENRLLPDGELEFWDVSEKLGGKKSAVGFSAVAADFNEDGYPDIYVCSYNHYGTVMPDDWKRATNGTRNLMFLSDGDGSFTESAASLGIADPRWSYAAGVADIDEDGHFDLFVANDYGEKALYMRRGERFVDEAKKRGVLDPGNGMGVSFADFDNDGDLDLHLTNMSSTAGNRILSRLVPGAGRDENVLVKVASGNSLFENTGEGFFDDVTLKAGPFGAGWAWGGGFFDLDNDGLEDIYTPNGFVSGKSMADT